MEEGVTTWIFGQADKLSYFENKSGAICHLTYSSMCVNSSQVPLRSLWLWEGSNSTRLIRPSVSCGSTSSRVHPNRHDQPQAQHREPTLNTPETFAWASTRLPSVFNPYSECCPTHDRPGADALRTQNLVRWLTASLESRVDTMWIARDLGYRGGRRTGLPLTDEIHLNQAGVYCWHD